MRKTFRKVKDIIVEGRTSSPPKRYMIIVLLAGHGFIKDTK